MTQAAHPADVGVFLPAAIVIWFVSIVLRYALSF